MQKYLDALVQPTQAVLDVEAMNSVAASAPGFVKVQHLGAQALNNPGAMTNAAKRFSAAGEAHRQSIGIKEKLTETFPSVPQYRQELAASLNNLGAVYSLLNRPEEAQAADNKANNPSPPAAPILGSLRCGLRTPLQLPKIGPPPAQNLTVWAGGLPTGARRAV